MTVSQIFALRESGQATEAYEEARRLYAYDKSPCASSAMFWTATDILKKYTSEGQADEAAKILLALKRLLAVGGDVDGQMYKTLQKCEKLVQTAQNEPTGPIGHIKVGRWGEAMAADYLLRKGYAILERDWHSKHRDIDIIARQEEQIVFVEVKTRSNHRFTEPIAAVNYRKLKNLRMAINHYLNYKKLDDNWRFDVITIVGNINSKEPEIEHIEDFSLL